MTNRKPGRRHLPESERRSHYSRVHFNDAERARIEAALDAREAQTGSRPQLSTYLRQSALAQAVQDIAE